VCPRRRGQVAYATADPLRGATVHGRGIDVTDRASTFKASQPIAGFGISKFRTLRDVEVLCPGPVTVICGPNNTGKSSFLQALRVYTHLAQIVTQSNADDHARLVDDIFAGGEKAKIGVDVKGVAFIKMLESIMGMEDACTLAEGVHDELGGPLWLRFKRDYAGWDLDHEATLDPVNDALTKWNRPTRANPLDLSTSRETQIPLDRPRPFRDDLLRR
jgi:hypothetical protein